MLMMIMQSSDTIAQGPDSTWGMRHFVHLFRADIEKFLARLTFKTKPRKIVVCMIYYPDETPSGGWADRVLGYLQYFKNPTKLQTAIQQIFAHATSQIVVPGVEVVPFPLFSVMDGKDSSLYCSGVEPSAKGNEAIATALLDKLVDQ
jgi:ribosomal protein S18 acetylase RimI-like enzyme